MPRAGIGPAMRTATSSGDATYDAAREGSWEAETGNLLSSDYNWGYMPCNENAIGAKVARQRAGSDGKASAG